MGGTSREWLEVMESCGRCGALCIPASHICPTRYIVWSPDHGDTEEDGHAFYAHSESAAAEAWAEWSDSNSADYGVIRGNATLVHVKREGSDRTAAFTVTGEVVPQYRAHVAAFKSIGT